MMSPRTIRYSRFTSLLYRLQLITWPTRIFVEQRTHYLYDT